ncbi:L-galactose dehydrogenase [Xylariales sp. PMI_506]|nr:L-galactose dehydrogenase [Xylariales sp. PMI_506]
MGSIDPKHSSATAARPPLHEVMPPLILGTATFNRQYVSDPFNPEVLPALAIVSRTLDLGIAAFDTSPYYGPSEIILGDCLAHPQNAEKHPRDSYFLVTKAGRVAGDEFDYSPEWVRYSVRRSLARLHTSHLDLVYMHDVEFVSPAEVLAAVRELRRLRDEDGVVRYVGISGYPVPLLCELAEMVLRETGEPLDAVLSYSHFTIQNTTLGSAAVADRFRAAGVDVVLNASMLGMGLLTTRGADAGPMAEWHPSPPELRGAVKELVRIAQEGGEKIEEVAIRWALDSWARDGAPFGALLKSSPTKQRVGVSVMGVSAVPELEETWELFSQVIEGLQPDAASAIAGSDIGSDASAEKKEAVQTSSLERRDRIRGLVEDKMWAALGQWKDYSWSSPDPAYVNTRKPEDKAVVPEDPVTEAHLKKLGIPH